MPHFNRETWFSLVKIILSLGSGKMPGQWGLLFSSIVWCHKGGILFNDKNLLSHSFCFVQMTEIIAGANNSRSRQFVSFYLSSMLYIWLVYFGKKKFWISRSVLQSLNSMGLFVSVKCQPEFRKATISWNQLGLLMP